MWKTIYVNDKFEVQYDERLGDLYVIRSTVNKRKQIIVWAGEIHELLDAVAQIVKHIIWRKPPLAE